MLSLGKRSLWTGSDGDVIRSAATATEDGGDVDVLMPLVVMEAKETC
jgi:hypothetical protein